eukprot:SAG11_NODE_613_length_8205_cov_28.925487_7_plen_85_part_00
MYNIVISLYFPQVAESLRIKSSRGGGGGGGYKTSYSTSHPFDRRGEEATSCVSFCSVTIVSILVIDSLLATTLTDLIEYMEIRR